MNNIFSAFGLRKFHRIPRIPHTWKYATIGGVLGLGSPIGLLGLRYFLTQHSHISSWISSEWAQQISVYLYTTFGTVIAFIIFAYQLGKRSDFFEGQADSLQKASAALKNLAITDGLTGLFVHSYIVDRLQHELLRARRYKYPLGCLFIDIDNFKKLNDTHGHLFGDQVLTQISQIMKNSLRQTDVLGRYGGDELLAILPKTSESTMVQVSERIRKEIENLQLLSDGSPVNVTVSIGAYSTANAISVNQILEMSDHLLREAKKSGKNKTICRSIDILSSHNMGSLN